MSDTYRRYAILLANLHEVLISRTVRHQSRDW